MNSLQFLRAFLSCLVITVFLSASALIAQEQIGGPYTVDENTILLMHFDGDLTNQSTLSDDGVLVHNSCR